MKNAQIRLTIAADVPALIGVIDETDLFPSDMLEEMLAPSPAGQNDAICLTCLHGTAPVGLCYSEPERMADAVWNMRALAILPAVQGNGLGGQLVSHMERVLTATGQRLLIVDTSGTEDFALTRSFYQKAGYEEEARIRDYWAVGDDKVTFCKLLL